MIKFIGDVGGTCGQNWTPWSTHYLLTTPMWKRSILLWYRRKLGR